jgi:hypothetical protein
VEPAGKEQAAHQYFDAEMRAQSMSIDFIKASLCCWEELLSLCRTLNMVRILMRLQVRECNAALCLVGAWSELLR